MRLLLAGSWLSEIHEQQLYTGFKSIKELSLEKFSWSGYFYSKSKFFGLYLKAEEKYLVGPVMAWLNIRLFFYILRIKPDVVFFYRPVPIHPFLYKIIKVLNNKIKLVIYNNDDTYSVKDAFTFRYLKRSLKYADLALAYRPKNYEEYRVRGINSALFLPWYDRDLFKPAIKVEYKYDVVFIGHFEPDLRLPCLLYLHKKGLRVGLFGPREKVHSGWLDVLEGTELEYLKNDLEYLNLKEYYQILKVSKVALCFFSKRNNDVYTRRCFEITATGTVMLSESSKELEEIFVPDKEVFFFNNLATFRSQADYLFSDGFDLKKYEQNITNKITQGAMSNYDRAHQFYNLIKGYGQS